MGIPISPLQGESLKLDNLAILQDPRIALLSSEHLFELYYIRAESKSQRSVR